MRRHVCRHGANCAILGTSNVMGRCSERFLSETTASPLVTTHMSTHMSTHTRTYMSTHMSTWHIDRVSSGTTGGRWTGAGMATVQSGHEFHGRRAGSVQAVWRGAVAVRAQALCSQCARTAQALHCTGAAQAVYRHALHTQWHLPYWTMSPKSMYL